MASNTNDYSLSYPSLSEYQTIKTKKEKLPDYSAMLNSDEFNPKVFKSIAKQSKPQPILELNFDRFVDLSAHLNNLLREEYEEFSLENQQLIAERISWIHANHGVSAKKLSKAYDWENNISRWLGDDLTKTLKQQLHIQL
jgi:hypothetical protein